MEVVERTGEIGGLEVAWREAGTEDGRPPILYVHGVPTGSWEWAPFLERTGGIAPDLPGFGRSTKPAEFDYSIQGCDRFLGAFTAAVGLERFSLVVHDWGAVALALAQRFPERVERLVLCACVPLLPGFTWHRVARVWRRPLLGEFLMGLTTKPAFKLLSRRWNARPGPMPDDWLEAVWRDFDHGTQRAILKLHRASPEELLARSGERLGEIRCPTLMLWPLEDPCGDTAWGKAYADALGGEVRLELIEGAGHWPWLDRPDLIDMVADFVRAGTVS